MSKIHKSLLVLLLVQAVGIIGVFVAIIRFLPTHTLMIGIVATVAGFFWAKYEHDNPYYWESLGISQNASHVLNIVTSTLYPYGYFLILFAPGHSWVFNIGMVLITHFVGVHFIGGLIYGAIGGLSARRRARRMIDEFLERDQDG